MNIERIKSDLRMRGLYFPECSIKRNTQVANGKLNIDVSRHIAKKTDNEYDVTVTVHIDKEEEDMQVCVVACATFDVDSSDSDEVKTLIESNTVAIMFPFIRSQVSLITTQPGMMPIVLPPINTARLNISEQ